jgi:hypothetical protein
MQPYGPNRPVIRPISTRSSLDFTSRPPLFAPDASLLVSCIRCRRLHSAAQPFEFNPLCPACAGPIRSIDE